MATHPAWETENPVVRPETTLPGGLAQAVPGLQVGRLPGIDHTMPAGFATPVIAGIYEDNPVGPVMPYPTHDGPQLGGHNTGHGPNIDEPEED